MPQKGSDLDPTGKKPTPKRRGALAGEMFKNKEKPIQRSSKSDKENLPNVSNLIKVENSTKIPISRRISRYARRLSNIVGGGRKTSEILPITSQAETLPITFRDVEDHFLPYVVISTKKNSTLKRGQQVGFEKFRENTVDGTNLFVHCTSDNQKQNEGLYKVGITNEVLSYLSISFIINLLDLAKQKKLNDDVIEKYLKELMTFHNFKEKIFNDFLETELSDNDREYLANLEDVFIKESKKSGSKYRNLKLSNLDEIENTLKELEASNSDINYKLFSFWSLINYIPKDEVEAKRKTEIAQSFLSQNYIILPNNEKETNSIKLALLKCCEHPLNQNFFKLVIAHSISQNALAQANTLREVAIPNWEFLLKTFISGHKLPNQELLFEFIRQQESAIILLAKNDQEALKIENEVADLINKLLKTPNCVQPVISFEKILNHAISSWSLEGVKYLMNNCISPNIEGNNSNYDLFIKAAEELKLIVPNTIFNDKNEIIDEIISKVEMTPEGLIKDNNKNFNPILISRFFNMGKIEGKWENKKAQDEIRDQILSQLLEKIVTTTDNNEHSDLFRLYNSILGLNIFSREETNKHFLQIAIDKSSIETVKLLCKNQSIKDFKAIEINGVNLTPLEYAFLKCNEKQIRDTDQKDIDHKDVDQETGDFSKFQEIANVLKEKIISEYLGDTSAININGSDPIKKIIIEENKEIQIVSENSIIRKFEEIVSTQADKANPDKPYRGLGVDVTFLEIEEKKGDKTIIKKVAKIDEFFDIGNGRIKQNISDKPQIIKDNKQFEGKYLFAIEVEEKTEDGTTQKVMKEISEILKIENFDSEEDKIRQEAEKLKELVKICHQDGNIKFLVSDDEKGENCQEYVCQREKQYVYVTDNCKDLEGKNVLTDKKGTVYNPLSQVHGIEVLGRDFIDLGTKFPSISMIPTEASNISQNNLTNVLEGFVVSA